MHWLTEPGTSQPESSRITVARPAASCARSPVSATAASHIGQALLRRRGLRRLLRRELDQRRPGRRLRRRPLAKIQEVVDGYPGLLPRRADLPEGTHQGGAHRLQRPIIVSASTARTWTSCARRRTRSSAIDDVDGIVDVQVELPRRTSRRSQVEVDLDAAQRYGLKPGDIRRQPPRWSPARRSATSSADGRAYDVHVWSTPETRNSLDDVENLPIDTPSGDVGSGSATSPTCRSARPRTPDHARAARGRIDVGANVSGRDLGSVVAEVEAGWPECSLPAGGYDAEVIGESAERAHAQQHRLLYGIGRRLGHLLSCCRPSFGSCRLATLVVPHPADGAGGRCPGRPVHRRACSRWVRWWASSPCSASPPATAS